MLAVVGSCKLVLVLRALERNEVSFERYIWVCLTSVISKKKKNNKKKGCDLSPLLFWGLGGRNSTNIDCNTSVHSPV